MKVCLLIMLLCVAACSSTSQVPVRSIEKIKPGNGVVLLSATRSYQFSVVGKLLPGPLVAQFKFANVDTGAVMEVLSEDVVVKRSLVVKIPHDMEQTGQVLVMQVPAGKYRLESWRLAADLGVSVGNISSEGAKLPTKPFKVEAGKITYFGNFHLNVLRNSSFLNMTVPSGANLECDDQAERDIIALRDNRPEVNNLKILNQRCTFPETAGPESEAPKAGKK